MSSVHKITVQVTVDVPRERAWATWTEPEHIMQWNNASADWHTPRAYNDVKVGGRFNSRMEARDGSEGFNFTGTYDEVKEPELLVYTLDDERQVRITFNDKGKQTEISQTFDAETSHSIELQEAGWQAIMDNYKGYVESL